MSLIADGPNNNALNIKFCKVLLLLTVSVIFELAV